ncbi:collagen-like protein [Calothrix sp. FACHB-1219]|uniref:collagen-like protein n=1 Tax=unclassified Calothrix TaxID=2619626 RepID=UPI00168472C5|nr:MULTISPECIES: collagen-like protein [unclassified Calothrix]MBD2203266.1 collagen-like protein [Calothrix sp. FACHB-168]MBD2216438.1 collagen-like protein [Calothrix sp. FACHB-1219]
MKKGLLHKLPLLLIFCLFTSLLPASGSVFCSASAYDDYRRTDRDYGTDGSKGSDGRSGRSGRNGENQTIVVDGSPVNLDLSGQNGEDGEDGERGDRPSCRNQPDDVSHDIHAPDGGDGGRGGRGGDGGNGGSLTVYYKNLEDLRKISVRATGGDGGRGGRGANGAQGCNCRRRKWEVKTCTGTPGSPDYKCTEKTYRCHDGQDGRTGEDGSDGNRGRLGTLSIVKGKESLAADVPSLQVAVSELAAKQFNLSKNKWNIKTGANVLLAPGSAIADEYREFDQRLEGTFQLVWQDRQPISSFAGQVATINLNDNKQVEVSFPEDLWVDGNSKTEANLTTFTVNNAIAKKDVTRLAVAEFAGAEQNLNLKIVDLAAKSDALQTQFRVKFRAQDNSSGFSDFRTVYEGDIPGNLVTRDYNRFILALGKLPISAPALSPGVNVDIEVIATRSLGGRSAKQSINWQGHIRKR